MTGDEAKSKIKKLLALAGDNDDHEAQAALIAARRLMAQYKLSEKDLPGRNATLNQAIYDVDTFSGVRNAWFPILAQVIAEHHCCGTFQRGYTKSQVQNIGFAGLDDDPVIAKTMFTYACDHIMRWGKNIKAELGCGRQMNALVKEYVWNYAIGFSEGLEQQYQEQDKRGDPGMELMVVVPVEVTDWKSKLPKHTIRREKREYHPFVRRRGYDAGYAFNPIRGLRNQGESE